MSTLPFATIAIPAYQYERYVARAIDSALAQDWPADLLEVIVVDDGSTDRTPEIVASYGDRIRSIRTENQGVAATVSLAYREARGEVIALLSADDECPPDRLRRQWEILAARPEVGLVYGDMEVVGPDGEQLHPSFTRMMKLTPLEGTGILGRLLYMNCVSGGPTLIRASLRDLILPMPAETIHEDWWMALKAAESSQIAYLDRPVYRYRHHGSNMNLGATPEKALVLRKGEVAFRRATLRGRILDLSTVNASELRRAVLQLDLLTERVAEVTGSWLHDLLPVSEEERSEADEAFARGDAASAIGIDPAHLPARRALGVEQAPPAPLETRRRVTVARAAEVLSAPELLSSFLQAVGAEDDATLVLHAPGGDIAHLQSHLLSQVPALLDDAAADVVLYVTPHGICAERFVLERADDVLTHADVPPSGLPRFTAMRAPVG